MQIAIISDSHGSLDRLAHTFENLQNIGITNVIHAGDGIHYGIEKIFKKHPEIQIYYALGNCDVNHELIEEVAKFSNVEIENIIFAEINNVKFGVSHIEGIAQKKLKNKNIQVFCHGHTHRAKVEQKENQLILNPGALMEDGKYFLLNLETFDVKQKRFDD